MAGDGKCRWLATADGASSNSGQWYTVGDDVAINGRWQSVEADSGGRGRQWKTVMASDERWWQTGRAAAMDGGRHWWIMWPLVANTGRRGKW